MEFPASLTLADGWNRIDMTGYNQNSGYTFTCGGLAALVDIMSSTLPPPNTPAGGGLRRPLCGERGFGGTL